MRIGLNAQILTDGLTGVTRYAANVIRLLPKIGQNHEFVIFGNSSDLKYNEHNVIIDKTQSLINSSSKRIIWEQIVLPQLAKKYNLDLITLQKK